MASKTYLEQFSTFLNEPAGMIMLAGVGLIAGFLAYRYWYGGKEFEGPTLEERVHDNYLDVLRKIGDGIHTSLRHGYVSLGIIHRHTTVTVNEPLTDRDEAEDVAEERGGFEVDLFLVRPRGKWWNPFPVAAWFLLDYIAGFDFMQTIYAVPRKVVDRVDQIVIPRDLPMHPVGGIYVPRAAEGMEIAFEEAFLSLLEDTAERFSNSIELMNYLDTQFSQRLELMKREHEMEREGWEDVE